MAELTDSPVPFRTLYRPAGVIGDDPVGSGASLGFHVGAGVGGQPEDVLAFRTFVGGTLETTTIGSVMVERRVPLRHPYLPEMVAVAVRCEGTGKGIDAIPGWSDWRVLVDFAVAPYGFDGDTPYMTIQRDYGADAITLPGKAYAVGGVKLDHDVAVVLPIQNYTATMFNVPTLDDSVFKLLVGKVNNATFLGYDAETVYFGGVKDQITRTIGGVLNRTVSLSLSWRPASWNELVLPSGVWAAPVNIDDGSKFYALGNFDLLL